MATQLPPIATLTSASGDPVNNAIGAPTSIFEGKVGLPLGTPGSLLYPDRTLFLPDLPANGAPTSIFEGRASLPFGTPGSLLPPDRSFFLPNFPTKDVKLSGTFKASMDVSIDTSPDQTVCTIIFHGIPHFCSSRPPIRISCFGTSSVSKNREIGQPSNKVDHYQMGFDLSDGNWTYFYLEGCFAWKAWYKNPSAKNGKMVLYFPRKDMPENMIESAIMWYMDENYNWFMSPAN